MQIEVELKFQVEDVEALLRRLTLVAGGHAPSSADVLDQVDTYFSHPGRDFAVTDEALRVRRVNVSEAYLTYKGPKLDATTKTRREIEIPLATTGHSAADAQQMLLALGFGQVAQVHKQRTHWALPWHDRTVDVAVDLVEGVGTYVELEIVTTETDMPAARDCVTSLAAELGLATQERRSYLELLLARDR